MIRTTIYLPEKTHRLMKKLSINAEKPMSQVVTEAVETVYEEDLRDIEAAEKALAEYRKNPKSAVDFEEYLKRRKRGAR